MIRSVFDNFKQTIQSRDLKGKFARGGVILTGGTAFENIARLGRNMILARLLAPEYFGLMATVMAAVSLFQALTEVGVKQSVIQNKSGNLTDFLNVIWWFSSCRGLFLYIIAYAIAPYYCSFYSQLELVFPIRIAFLVLFFHGITSPRIYVLEKEFKYLKLTLIVQSAALLNVGIAIIASFFMNNIWPLILGYIAEFTIICILSYIICPFLPNLKINRTYLQEILNFARGMFGLPILTALYLQIDVFAIGKLLTMDQLGLYYLARNLSAAPLMAFTKIIRPLLLPTFSTMQDDPKALSRSLLKTEYVISALTSPFFAFCIVFANPILGIIYGWQYSLVAIPFAVLMVDAFIRFFSGVLMQVCFALALPNIHRRFALLRIIIAIILIYPAIQYFGITGASLTLLISMASLFIFQVIWSSKKLEISISNQLFSIAKGICYSFIVIIPCLLVRTIFPDNHIVIFSCSITFLLLAWALVIRSFFMRRTSALNSFS